MNESMILGLLASKGFQINMLCKTVRPDKSSLIAASKMVAGVPFGTVVRWEVPTQYSILSTPEDSQPLDIGWLLPDSPERVEQEAVVVPDNYRKPCLVMPRNCLGAAEVQLFANFWGQISGVTHWGNNDQMLLVKVGKSGKSMFLNAFGAQADAVKDRNEYMEIASVHEAFRNAVAAHVDPTDVLVVPIGF